MDAEENLCLSWREGPWALSVEIDPDGDPEWWAYSTETKKYLSGRHEINSEFE